MATYFLNGRYTQQALGQLSAERTGKTKALVEKYGGKVKSIHALLGCTDLVIIVDLPGTKEAMQASLGLSKLLNMSISTSEAVTVEEFDKIVKGV
jgi:uncharacterized protein with GYD domain